MQLLDNMRSLALAIALTSFIIGPVAADDHCEYASQRFSIGSSRCDCPSIKVDNLGSTGENSRITSARLTCNKDGWTETQSLCIDMGKMNILPEYYRLAKMYCPLSLNPEETEKVFKEASNANSLAAVRGICARLGGAAAACKSMIEVLSK